MKRTRLEGWITTDSKTGKVKWSVVKLSYSAKNGWRDASNVIKKGESSNREEAAKDMIKAFGKGKIHHVHDPEKEHIPSGGSLKGHFEATAPKGFYSKERTFASMKKSSYNPQPVERFWLSGRSIDGLVWYDRGSWTSGVKQSKIRPMSLPQAKQALEAQRVQNKKSDSDDIIGRLTIVNKEGDPVNELGVVATANVGVTTMRRTRIKNLRLKETFAAFIEEAGRKPKRHGKGLAGEIEEYMPILNYFKELDLTAKVNQIDKLIESAKSGEGNKKEIADQLLALIDHDKGPLGNTFFSNLLKIDDGPKRIASALKKAA